MKKEKKKEKKRRGEPRKTGPRQTCLKVTDCAGVPGGRWGGRDNGYLCLSRGTRRQLFSCALVCVCVCPCASLLWRRISKSSPTSLYIIAITDILQKSLLHNIHLLLQQEEETTEGEQNRTEQNREEIFFVWKVLKFLICQLLWLLCLNLEKPRRICCCYSCWFFFWGVLLVCEFLKFLLSLSLLYLFATSLGFCSLSGLHYRAWYMHLPSLGSSKKLMTVLCNKIDLRKEFSFIFLFFSSQVFCQWE